MHRICHNNIDVHIVGGKGQTNYHILYENMQTLID